VFGVFGLFMAYGLEVLQLQLAASSATSHYQLAAGDVKVKAHITRKLHTSLID
jgi:hypothetical protein